MIKPFLLFYGAVDTFSGYGSHARDIVKCLIKQNKYDIKIIACSWGNTPKGFLKADNTEHKEILDRIIQGQINQQPDIYMMVSIPNEMQRVGKFNILVTAGIETDLCAPQWIEGLNRADLVLVSSEHAKEVFVKSKFNKHNNQTQQIEGLIEAKVPIEVLFEGVDTNVYRNIADDDLITDVAVELDEIPEEFNFLFAGHWLQGEFGEDRKNVGGLIKTFLETFKNRKVKPGLILKTQSATPSIMDREEMITKINVIRKSVDGELPNVYLLHGELTDEEVNEMYNHPKVKAFVSFTKGEGFGRPLLEASLSQKPIITTNWSGHIDFLYKDFTTLLPGTLTQIHPTAVVENMLIPESKWFTVDYNIASKALDEVFKNPKIFEEKGKRQAYRSRTQFSLEKMAVDLEAVLRKYIVEQKPIVLPQLKKIQLPQLKKV